LEKNNSWPRVFITRGNIWTRVKIQASNWTRVFNTRVQVDTCNNTRVQLAAWINYTRPIGLFIPLATLSERHVASWTRVYSNRYCRHAANCGFFCSEQKNYGTDEVK
jgi:hypothetical protein